jgi:hypothetical protein
MLPDNPKHSPGFPEPENQQRMVDLETANSILLDKSLLALHQEKKLIR